MIENEKHLKEVLSVLQKEGILDNVILIGSWCLLFYKYVFDNFEPTIRTTDIDFYVPDSKKIKARNGVIKSFKDINYDIIYDSITHKSMFISPDGFELEFLTKLNRENLACIRLGNTGIFAESLPYVDIFTGNYIEINYEGIKLKVASPASYVIQKLLINNARGDKKQKDIESIKHVVFYIGASIKYCDELSTLFKSLPKKWKQKVKLTVLENNIEALYPLLDN